MTDRIREGGFTLLEVLVSLIVLGLLVVGLNQGVRTGLDLWNMQSRQMNGTAELDSTFRLLRTLLTDVPRNPTSLLNPGAPPLAILLNGTADRLSFVGDLPTGLGTIRRADITILLREQSLLLSWKPHRHEFATTTPDTMESELLHGVDRLEFAYFGVAAPGSPAGWVAEWAGPAIPKLIRIRLGVSKASARRWPDLIVAPQLATPET
jgi:prepilin-type N-terminal cleavage/methylation domain-containing protein